VGSQRLLAPTIVAQRTFRTGSKGGQLVLQLGDFERILLLLQDGFPCLPAVKSPRDEEGTEGANASDRYAYRLNYIQNINKFWFFWYICGYFLVRKTEYKAGLLSQIRLISL
jgi:hypothetical protein